MTQPNPGSVLVLGAASDIGRAIAREYAKAGRPLILAARNASRLDADAQDLHLRYGIEASTIEFDVVDLPAHRGFIEKLPALPQTVISVVGLLGDHPTAQRDFAAADLVMRTNYNGPASILGEVAHRMEMRGSGTIIGISSVAGDRGRASNYVYGSAKAGFSQFLSGLRNRMTACGVRVITIKPGFCRTRMTVGMDLPKALTAEPAQVAKAIFLAEAKGRDVVYVLPIWQIIMLIIRGLPEAIFKRLKL